jgi:SAM-dependent methyltransferase
MKTEDLDDVYGATSPEASRRLYDQWSSSYDADNLAKGFRLPGIGAGLLASYIGRTHGPILDAGCGTGLVGEALMVMGYHHLSGCDLSPEMLAQAARTGAYADLVEADMGAALPYETDHFAGFVCVGSFGPGHAPPSTLTHLARVTRQGGFGVFNVTAHSYEDQGFPQAIDALSASGAWRVVQKTAPFRPYLIAEPDLLCIAYVVEML